MSGVTTDRRAFLALSCAGALALAARPLAAAVPAPLPRLRKALKIGMVQVEGTLAERFALLRRIGFDGVELDSPSDLDPEEVIAARDASGLLIPGVVDSEHWRSTLGDPDAAVRARGIAALETALRDCRRYGGTTVLLVPGVVNEHLSYQDVWTRSQAAIREVLPLAHELGVKIALENVWNHFLLSPLEAARYVDSFESDAIGWHFDVGNVVNYGWPAQWIETLGPRILKLDVKEYSRKLRDEQGLWKGFDAELGEGDCDWPAVMRALEKIGYEGWAAAEVRGGDEARLREISERMDRCFAG